LLGTTTKLHPYQEKFKLSLEVESLYHIARKLSSDSRVKTHAPLGAAALRGKPGSRFSFHFW